MVDVLCYFVGICEYYIFWVLGEFVVLFVIIGFWGNEFVVKRMKSK